MLLATDTTAYTHTEADFEPICEGDIAALAEGDRYQVVARQNGDLMLRTAKQTQTVATGIAPPPACLVILDENPLHLLIGTAEAHIYRFKDGKTERLESFDKMPVRQQWHTPWGGPPDVRSLAATADGWVYADIHVGSIMRSPDRGQTWEPVTPDLHEDVHQVATSSQIDDRVYANTARAVYLSDDRGRSWQHRAEGFPYRYGRAIAVHPDDPDCLLATVSKGPHGDAQGRLYRTDDAGRTWAHVTGGFPDALSHNIDTFHIAFSRDGRAWVVNDRTLYVSEDKGQTWKSAWQAPEPIQMIACA